MIIQAQALLEYFDKSIPLDAKSAFCQLLNPQQSEHFVFMGTQRCAQDKPSTKLMGNLNLEHAIQCAKNYQVQCKHPSPKSSAVLHEDFFLFDNLCDWESILFSHLDLSIQKNLQENTPLVYIFKQAITDISTKDEHIPWAFIEKYFSQPRNPQCSTCVHFTKEQWLVAFERYFNNKKQYSQKFSAPLPNSTSSRLVNLNHQVHDLSEESDSETFHFTDIFYQTSVDFHSLYGILFLHQGIWNWLSLQNVKDVLAKTNVKKSLGGSQHTLEHLAKYSTI